MSMAATSSLAPQSSPLPQVLDSTPFASKENISIIALSAAALVVSGIALALLLFTPVGAGVVGMGLLIGCAVVSGSGGFAGLGWIIKRHFDHVERCEQTSFERARLTSASTSASVAIGAFCNQKSDESHAHNRAMFCSLSAKNNGIDSYYGFEMSNDLNPLKKSLPTEFPLSQNEDGLNRLYLLAEYLKYIFFPTEDPALIPLRPASIAEQEWGRFHVEALGYCHQNEQRQEWFIGELRRYFDSLPQCAKQYIILCNQTCIRYKRVIPELLNELQRAFVFGFQNPYYLSDSSLVEFIILHADQLFPEEYQTVTQMRQQGRV